MQVLNVEENESSPKINLKNVSWWKFIKNTCRPKVLVTRKLSKERYISLAVEGSHLVLHISMTKVSVGLPQPKKHTLPKRVYQKYEA